MNAKKRVFRFALICPVVLLPSLVSATDTHAAECVTKTCISVFVQDGQVVIEAHKGSGPKSYVARKAPPKVKVEPRVAPSRPAHKPVSKVRKAPAAPKKITVRKRVAPKVVRKVAPPMSLSDRLIKLIPTGSILHEPATNALVNIPVIYWVDLPSVFSTKVAIIGEAVDVAMRPSFLWSFGDGSLYATTSPGSAYPNQVITHTYSRAGTYAVVMVATWGGVWTNNGVARAITGQVRKVSVATVTVANAPTRLTK